MEQMSLEKIGKELKILKKMISSIQEKLNEDELELSEEVLQEIEESRARPEEEMIPLEDIKKEFL